MNIDSLWHEKERALEFANNWRDTPGSENDKKLAVCRPGEQISISDTIKEIPKKKYGFRVIDKFVHNRTIHYDLEKDGFIVNDEIALEPYATEWNYFVIILCIMVLVLMVVVPLLSESITVKTTIGFELSLIFILFILNYYISPVPLVVIMYKIYQNWREKRRKRIATDEGSNE